MRRSSSARTFTIEIEVSNLTDNTMNDLDEQLTQMRLTARTIENILATRHQGDAAMVITDEKRATDTADLEPF